MSWTTGKRHLWIITDTTVGKEIKFGERIKFKSCNLLVINIGCIILWKCLCTCSFLILSEQMLLWKQLNYIPILLLSLYSNIHNDIRGLSRDRFDESPARALTHVKAPGLFQLCNCLISVVLFPVWTSGGVICPICYQEFIPHRKSMETIVCLGLTHPELYCIRGALCSQQQLSLLATKLSPLHTCSATLCVWMAFICWCFSHHGFKHTHIHMQTHIWADTGRERAQIEFMLGCYLSSLKHGLGFEPSAPAESTPLTPGFGSKSLAAYLCKCSFPMQSHNPFFPPLFWQLFFSSCLIYFSVTMGSWQKIPVRG